MTTFERLAIKIKKDTGKELVDFKRTYAGIHMLGSGAYTWLAWFKDLKIEVSSTVSATELLKRDKIEFYDASGHMSQMWIIN